MRVIHEGFPRAVISPLAKTIALISDHAVDALDVEATLHVCRSDSRAVVVVKVASLLLEGWIATRRRPTCTARSAHRVGKGKLKRAPRERAWNPM
jgi:hypothetical protein